MSDTPAAAAANAVRCHYDVLGLGDRIDADAAAIKKAHRKLALRWHPDKNQHNLEEANHEFRLVQQAYECLSDPAERRWYDEHRDALLRGWTAGNKQDEDGSGRSDELFDRVVPFRHSGCYDGFGDDDEGGFYAVYRKVFAELRDLECEAAFDVGNGGSNVDVDALFPGFGDAASDYGPVVSVFYAAWENFSTLQSFAWEDTYDTRDAEHRKIRRVMEEENKKARKAVKKKFHAELEGLVAFVKKRDPRVRAHKTRLEREKKERELYRQAEEKRKKSENKAAREAWKLERQLELEELAEQDVAQGKFRLADDDDEEDDYGKNNNKKNKKKKHKKKKKGKKNRLQWDSSSGEENDDDVTPPDTATGNTEQHDNNTNQHDEQNTDDVSPNKSAQEKVGSTSENNATEENKSGQEEQIPSSPSQRSIPTDEVSQRSLPDTNNVERSTNQADVCVEADKPMTHDDDEGYLSSSSSSSEEPDFWRCDVCRKDFKSQKQMENHLKSKKHKEAMKKYEKKLKKELQEQAALELDDLVEEMEVL